MTLSTDTPYALHHRSDILAIVERMQRERALTTIEFADGHAIVSSVLEVRRDANALILDVARDADQNKRLFASQTLGFVTELDQIQIAFETNAALLVAFSDGPAAVVDLPTAVVRLQRREWFRAALPVQPPIRCTILDADGNATPAQAIDLSAGGTALVVDDVAAAGTRTGGNHELILSLPEIGRVELEATLCRVMPARSSAPGVPPKVRLGFRFESVPPKTASRIQRYVQRLEVHELRVLRRRG